MLKRFHPGFGLLQRDFHVGQRLADGVADHLGEIGERRAHAAEAVELVAVLTRLAQHARAERAGVAHVDQRYGQVLRPRLDDLALVLDVGAPAP